MLLQFYLFRLMLTSKTDLPQLYHFDSKDLIKKILLARPAGIVRANALWAIANTIDEDNVLYFKVGRSIKKPGEIFDSTQREFIAAEIQMANSADCIFDCENQVLAIESATDCPLASTLSKYIRGIIEKYIQDGVNEVFTPEEQVFLKNKKCVINSLYDPFSFVNEIDVCRRVLECRMYAERPNPFDYESLFQNPSAVIMEKANALEAFTVLKNNEKSLNKQFIKDIAGASAAVGNNVTAKIENEDSGVVERIYLNRKDKMARVDIDVPRERNLRNLVPAIRSKYRKIRKAEE